ncbi:MAG: hypothetical protein K2R98_17880 [Gemmataceae bacterium]|nr:hypothetical protein [Gemmataceae bacterium]
MKFCSRLVLAAILALGFAGLADANPHPTEATKVSNGTITDEHLGKMLEDMGFETKPGTYNNGARYYDIVVSGKDLDIPIRIGLSPNKRTIWLMCRLNEVPADVTVDQMKAVLAAVNSKTGKMQFRLTGNSLKADQPMDNFGVTTTRLKREIDDFVAALNDTADIWGFKKPVPKTETAGSKTR